MNFPSALVDKCLKILHVGPKKENRGAHGRARKHPPGVEADAKLVDIVRTVG